MFWNLHWKDANRKNLFMYVGLRGMNADDFMRDPVWMRAHSGHSRYGAKFFTSDEKRVLMERWETLPEGYEWLCGSMRYKNALEVDEGAVNIQAIANAVASAAKEIGDQQVGTAKDDPAILLMVNQLSHLCQVSRGFDLSRYQHAKNICVDMCNAGGVLIGGKPPQGV